MPRPAEPFRRPLRAARRKHVRNCGKTYSYSHKKPNGRKFYSEKYSTDSNKTVYLQQHIPEDV